MATGLHKVLHKTFNILNISLMKIRCHATLFLLFITLPALSQFTPAPYFFRIPRQIPMVSMSTLQDVHVASFGAITNDGSCDLASIKAAIQAANAFSSAANPVRVVFAPGTYDLFPQTEGNHALSFNGLKYLLIDGQNAELLIHNPEIGFMSFRNCTDIIIRDLLIDYAVLPFTQGIVTATSALNNTFDVTIDEGFPLLSEVYFTRATEKWGMLKDSSGMLKRKATNLLPYAGWTQLSDRVFRVSQPNSSYIEQIDIGDYFVQIARNNGKSIFQTHTCRNFTFLNITSYASPSVTYAAFNNYEWNIIDCRIIPKTGRIQSANADCIHISGSYIGPWVEGCQFEAFSDDAVNMKYTYREILAVISPTKIKVKWEVQNGDSICFYNPREGKYLGSAAVIRSSHTQNNEYEITLSEPIQITQISPHQTGDKAYLSSRACESFVFRNNTIRNGRRYGMQLQNSYGVIENCLFENISNCGIRMENGVDWSEGFTPNNIIIRNNTFNNCGFDKMYIEDETAAAISARMTRLKSPCNESVFWCGVETANCTDWKGIRNITIENNTINYNKKGLHLECIDNLMVRNNSLEHNNSDITLNGNQPIPYEIQNCEMNPGSILEIPFIKEQTENIRFYPTIVSHDIHFSEMIHFVRIYSIWGTVILKMTGEFYSLNLSHLKPGIYIIQIDNKPEKFIKL